MKTTTITTKTKKHLARKLLGGVMIAFVLLLILSTSALGVAVQTRYKTINAGPADFGGSPHSFGGPSQGAVLIWDYDTSSGQLVATARVIGTLYWDDLFRGGCTRLTIKFQNVNGVNLSVRNIDRCGPGGDANNSANKLAIDESYASASLARLELSTAELSGGQLIGGGSIFDASPHFRSYLTTVRSGSAFFGLTNEPGELQFLRDSGNMIGTVTGNFFAQCGRMITEFRGITGSVLSIRSRDTCNARPIAESFESGSLFQIRLRVGEFSSGNLVNIVSRTFNFNGDTGNFELEPAETSIAIHDPINYAFTWTVPEPLNWHDLRSLDLRIRDDTETIMWIRWDEASNTFSLFNPLTGRFGQAFPVGSNARLQSRAARLDLAETTVAPVNSVLGTGANSPSVLLNLGLSLKPLAAGRTFKVEVAATDDLGNEDPFALAGRLTTNQE